MLFNTGVINKKDQKGKRMIIITGICLLLLLATWLIIGVVARPSQAASMEQPSLEAAAPDAVAGVFDYTTSFISGAETYINEDKPTENKGADTVLNNRTKGGQIERSIVQFDLSSLPSGVTIDGATMSFTTDTGRAEHTIDLYALLEDWLEMEATWNERNTGTAWSGGVGGGATGGLSINGASAGNFDPAADDTVYPVSTTQLEDLVEDWVDTGSGIDNNGVILISSGTKEDDEVKLLSSVTLDVDYSCSALANLGDRIWDDKNSNGIQDAGELGLAGITVNLLDSAGSPFSPAVTHVTGVGGDYTFTCLQPGTYIVEVELPAVAGIGYSPKTQGGDTSKDSDINPGTGRTDQVTVASGEDKSDIDSGITGLNMPDGGVNGLFYGDGDHNRYTLLSSALNGTGSFWALLDTTIPNEPKMQVAFLADPYLMNDNVFDDKNASPDPTSYMDSVDWTENRDMNTLHNSEKLETIEFTCKDASGATIGTGVTWTQTYMCKASDLGSLYGTGLSAYVGPLLGAGELQELYQFQPMDNQPSSATNQKPYAFLDCGKDEGDPFGPDDKYTAATSLAWNMNNTVFEPDQSPPSDSVTWKSPFGVGDTPLDFQYPYFDMVNRWEWDMVYEMSFDVSECVSDLTIQAGGIHNSPGKVFKQGVFPPGTLDIYDWGDLPDTIYPTDSGSNGARHNILITGNSYLGVVPPDNEGDGQGSSGADGDDTDANGDDEDGIAFLNPLVPGTNADIQVAINDGDGSACLSAFIDFDGDGTLDPVSYTAIDGGAAAGTVGDLSLSSGLRTLTVTVPGNTTGTTPARFRLTDDCGQGGNSTTGLADSGEVEDYMLASVGDYVWFDTNGNGLQDDGNTGVGGVTVNLLDGSGSPVLDADGQPVSTTTDANGAYEISGLPPGDYQFEFVADGYVFTDDDADGQGVNGDNNSDASPDTGITPTISLNPGETNNNVDTGLIYASAAIGNYVWVDENSDGYQDAGEPGIPNVMVVLYDDQGNEVARTITDAHGGYLFDGLPPGDYFVDVEDGTGGTTNTLPSGLTQTPPSTLPGADFGNQDHGTTGIPNTAFTGYPATVGVGGENLTADFGYNYNTQDCVDDPSDQNCGDPTGAIGDHIWIDADGDGVQDPEETGVSDVCVELFTPGPDGISGTADDVSQGTLTTDDTGYYIFDGLEPGAYVVQVCDSNFDPDGPLEDYTQTGDPDHFGTSGSNNDNMTTTPVILAPGDVFLNADFGYQPPESQNNTIGDKVWFDADADGIGPAGAPGGTDTDEYGIPGVTVALIDDQNNNGVWDAGEPIIATDITDANGDYLFPGLPDGSYIVWVNDTDNVLGDKTQTYDATAPSDDNMSSVVNLGEGSSTPVSNLEQDFGYTAPGQTDILGLIGDTVWLDINDDGVQDQGEPGLEGILVQLLDDGDNVIASTYTDENGNYYFGGLPAGTYTVVVTPPSGMDQTYDADDSTGPFNSPHESTVTIGTGEINLDQDFGYVGLGTIGDLVWEDLNADGDVDAGEEGIPGVTLDLYWDLNGNGQVDPGEPLVGSTVTANDGSYLFEGLPVDDGNGNAQFVVDVTDENGALLGYWHSLGTPEENDNSQTDPYAVTLTPGAPNNLTADFGYYVRPAALGNFVWNDHNRDGLQDADEPGIDGVEVTLTAKYADGTSNTFKTVTGDDPTTVEVEVGWYNFDNLLLDEDHASSRAGAPTAAQPVYTISVSLPQTALDGFGATQLNQGGDDMIDADDPTGIDGLATQGRDDATQNADSATESDPNAGYDFGFVERVAIGNIVWHDRNENSFLDNGENGIDGMEVRLFLDSNSNGDCEPGTDTTVGSGTITAGGGFYQFLDLEPSTAGSATTYYCVGVSSSDLSIFGLSKSSVGGAQEPDIGDQDVANGDDGVPSGNWLVSEPFAATLNGQTTPDSGDPPGYPDANSYMTVDFGVHAGATAIRLASMKATGSSYSTIVLALTGLLVMVFGGAAWVVQRRRII